MSLTCPELFTRLVTNGLNLNEKNMCENLYGKDVAEEKIDTVVEGKIKTLLRKKTFESFVKSDSYFLPAIEITMKDTQFASFSKHDNLCIKSTDPTGTIDFKSYADIFKEKSNVVIFIKSGEKVAVLFIKKENGKVVSTMFYDELIDQNTLSQLNQKLSEDVFFLPDVEFKFATVIDEKTCEGRITNGALFLEKITDEKGSIFEGYDLDKKIFDGTSEKMKLEGEGITKFKGKKNKFSYKGNYRNGILTTTSEMKDETGREFKPVTEYDPKEMGKFDENGIPNGRFTMTLNGSQATMWFVDGNVSYSKPKTGGKKARKTKIKKTHRKRTRLNKKKTRQNQSVA